MKKSYFEFRAHLNDIIEKYEKYFQERCSRISKNFREFYYFKSKSLTKKSYFEFRAHFNDIELWKNTRNIPKNDITFRTRITCKNYSQTDCPRLSRLVLLLFQNLFPDEAGNILKFISTTTELPF